MKLFLLDDVGDEVAKRYMVVPLLIIVYCIFVILTWMLFSSDGHGDTFLQVLTFGAVGFIGAVNVFVVQCLARIESRSENNT